MKRNNSVRLVFLFFMILIVTAFTSCKKFVDTPIPASRIPADVALNSDAGLTAALLGAYNSVANTSGSLVTYASLFSDDLTQLSAAGIAFQAQENTYDQQVDYGFFSNYYSSIYLTNVITEALAKSNSITPALANQVTGEAKFLRAFCNYRLVSLFGNPPLVNTSDITVSPYIGNTPAAEIYDSIVKDLLEAKSLLGTDYPSVDRVRANKYTVSALLSRVYLLKKDWANAELEAAAVINAGTMYNLPADLNTVFLKGSAETIWQLWNVNGYTPVGVSFIPSVTTNVTYRLRDGLFNAYDLNDKRKKAWIKAGTGSAAGAYYPYKYKQRVATTGTNAEYLVQFRLAEQYLNRAEARAQQNKVSLGLEDLNVVHLRSNVTGISATDQSDLLLKIEQERRLELMTEEGLRWFDLNRTGRTSFWLSPIKPAFTTKAILLPYFQDILTANSNLKQNPGY